MASALPQTENMRILEIPEKNGELELPNVDLRLKVNKKREMDVKLIKLRQNLIIPLVEPLPIGAFTHLQNNQIWEMILEYLTNSLDRYRSQNACPTFQNIISNLPSATPDERQVSGVLKIMNNGDYSRAWHGSPWHLRLVSKSWQRAADQVLRTEFEEGWHLELYHDHGWWWKNNFNVTRLTNADHAWTFPGNTSSISSLLQIIRLDERSMIETRNFYPRILEFLDEHGEHVKGLIVEWRETTISLARKYLNLLNLIVRMPNLKALSIDVGIRSPNRPEEVVDDLKDLILCHPFPSYLSLEVLSIQGHYHPMFPVVTEILFKCWKLKSISIPEYILEKESVVKALEGRNIEFIDCDMNKRVSSRILPMLAHLPLRKIVLPKYGYRDCLEFIRLLNLFGNTLEYLELPRMNSKFIEGRVALQLPKLKTLILDDWPSRENLDVLIPLSSLEHLEISYNFYFRDYKRLENKDRVRLVEHENDNKLEKSKIWTRFPNLRFVKIWVFLLDNYNSEHGMEVICDYVKRGKEITIEKLETSYSENYITTSSDSE